MSSIQQHEKNAEKKRYKKQELKNDTVFSKIKMIQNSPE